MSQMLRVTALLSFLNLFLSFRRTFYITIDHCFISFFAIMQILIISTYFMLVPVVALFPQETIDTFKSQSSLTRIWDNILPLSFKIHFLITLIVVTNLICSLKLILYFGFLQFSINRCSSLENDEYQAQNDQFFHFLN